MKPNRGQLALRPSTASDKAVRECPSACAAERRTGNDDPASGELENLTQGDCTVELRPRLRVLRIVCCI